MSESELSKIGVLKLQECMVLKKSYLRLRYKVIHCCLLYTSNVIAVFKYASLGVCVNFAEVSEFHAALYGAKEVAVHSIDISTIYRQGFAKFVQGVLTRTPPEPYGTLLRPVQILNALVEAAQTGREEMCIRDRLQTARPSALAAR